MSEDWNYASVVGMLLYLANNSRPDIAFAVSQCARFTHDPRQPHAVAVKRICRYLKGTRDRGIVLKPEDHLAIDCYVDADFCGTWKCEKPDDPASVKSRSGYMITLGGCPLTWTSKLQTEIALSTMQAEYVALSLSLRELIPLQDVVKELATHLGYKKKLETRAISTVFEDNMGALTLATCPHDTPHSKFYALKYHHFKGHVGKTLDIQKIDTREQKADIFTKGLVAETFVYLRGKIMGW
jgi:hypothetical protein